MGAMWLLSSEYRIAREVMERGSVFEATVQRKDVQRVRYRSRLRTGTRWSDAFFPILQVRVGNGKDSFESEMYVTQTDWDRLAVGDPVWVVSDRFEQEPREVYPRDLALPQKRPILLGFLGLFIMLIPVTLHFMGWINLNQRRFGLRTPRE